VSIQEKSLEIASVKWFYREVEGSGEKIPVVLLHGLPAHSFIWWDTMTELGKQGYRAIAPDWIGSGFSDKPDRRDFNYTPQGYLEALEGFIAALEIETCYLVVQGFLAHLGLQYAFKFPEQIERLVILNTPLSSNAKLPGTMKQWGWLFVGDMLTQDPLLVDRTLEKGSGFVIADKNLDVYRKPFLQSSDVGRAFVAIIQGLNFTETMTQIEAGFTNWTKPTLILWGCADPWLSVADAEKLANISSNITLSKLPDAKHYPQEHWSKEISEEMLLFLRKSS
jgi:pimeloyl-ACP methyl ester carboxylesterase